MLSISAVENSDAVTLTWTPPFTLDITDINPDIAGYCVDVVSSTSSATLHSECGINVTEFTYLRRPGSACTVYIFAVIPVNVVGNGTARAIMYHETANSKILMNSRSKQSREKKCNSPL